MVRNFDYGIIVTDQYEELDYMLDRLLRDGNSIAIQSSSSVLSPETISVIRDYLKFEEVTYFEYPYHSETFNKYLEKHCEQIIDLTINEDTPS